MLTLENNPSIADHFPFISNLTTIIRAESVQFAATPKACRGFRRDRDSVLLATAPKARRGLQEDHLAATREKIEDF